MTEQRVKTSADRDHQSITAFTVPLALDIAFEEEIRTILENFKGQR
jgi:hypothetical protein